MTLKKFMLKPGVNREQTRYAAMGGWYECGNIRFRNGSPEKIGGWARLSSETFLGVCRSLFNWATLGGLNLVGLGTNLKYYIENGGDYYDITPIRATDTLTDPFATTIGDETVIVTDNTHGATTGDFVTFSGASTVGGLNLNNEYQITVINSNSYSIEASTPAAATAIGGGTVTANYQLNVGYEVVTPLLGWGAGPFGAGPWGEGEATIGSIGMWSQSNFGEDLIFAQRNGPICIWDATGGLTARGTLLADDPDASDVPEEVLLILVSDISRFVFAFGCNEIGSSTLDPMLIRWSDQESAVNWTPAETNQAGSIRLSNGSSIVAVVQARQEILVWTDTAIYSLQYVGPASGVWGAQLVGQNISIVGPNAMAYANGIAYWMGTDRFYKYDGSVSSLRCDLWRYVFSDFNFEQEPQVYAGTNESFNEIWWFYPTAGSLQVDMHVIYNYADDIWYYGDIPRTAWLDSVLRHFPMGATYSYNLVNHESGVDDGTAATPVPLEAFIQSGEFDIMDGDHFAFCWRVLPDVIFAGSTAANPTVTLALTPLRNSGSGYSDPASVGGQSSRSIIRTVEVPVEEFTGQLDIRVRGRQMVVRISSDDLGVMWQWGAMRLDLRPDGRR